MFSNMTSLERCRWISIVGCQAKGCLIGYFNAHQWILEDDTQGKIMFNWYNP
jgi:hypothetical protein